jgi:AcrR family transcriptional regulator
MSDPDPGDAPIMVGNTRERILRAASDLFGRQGFSRVSMRMVALAAGVTKPALYYYFRDKESLFEECLADFNTQMEHTMRTATDAAAGIEAAVRSVAEALLTGSPFHPVRVHDELADHVSGGLRRRLRGTFQSVVVDPVTELFVALQQRGELRAEVSPEVASAMLIGVCMAFLRPAESEDWAPVSPGVNATPETTATLVAGLVLRGLAA